MAPWGTRWLEQEIERQREAAKQAEKLAALGTLLASLAHELNNPIAAILAQGELLAELADDPAVAERAAHIRAAAGRCARLVETFLRMARNRPLEPVSFPADRPLDDALDLVSGALADAGIALTVRRADPLPTILGEPTQISQILVNLLLNAQQALANSAGPRAVAVELGVDRSRWRVTYTVSDTGPGVPQEAAARIFEPFYTMRSAGTGLGLSIAHSSAAAHGGSLELLPGGPGATFRLSLPVAFSGGA